MPNFLEEALWRMPALIERTGLSKTTIEDMVARDLFPAPRQIGARAIAWLASEVIEWMRSRPIVTTRRASRQPD